MARPPKTHPLFHWRLKNERTLQAVADHVGCTQSHLSEIENWNNEPSLELAARLHELTKIDMKEFVKTAESAAQ
jgi:transcriptional regulator with XRE-family HTH domain